VPSPAHAAGRSHQALQLALWAQGETSDRINDRRSHQAPVPGRTLPGRPIAGMPYVERPCGALHRSLPCVSRQKGRRVRSHPRRLEGAHLGRSARGFLHDHRA
jgi:hypothetical protein